MTDYNQTDPEMLERMVVVEQNIKHIAERQESSDKKIDEIYELLVQARGAKWFALLLLSVFVFSLSNIDKGIHAIQVMLGIK